MLFIDERLVEAAGKSALDLLADVLEEANRIARPPEQIESGDPVLDDYSFIWRPAVEEHEQNREHGVRGALIAALRDGLEHLASSTPTMVTVLVEELERRRWIVFYRIALHLLRRCPTGALGALVTRATDGWRFEDHRLRHEYGLLLRDRFSLLPEPAQRQILDRIDAGPDVDGFRERGLEIHGRPPTSEDEQRYVNHWKLNRLALIGPEQLPNVWLERYRHWIVELGEPGNPDFPLYSTVMWRGPNSPKTAAELLSMRVEDIVSFLASWEPSSGLMSPSREDLGRVLQEVVAVTPERFAEVAERFRSLRSAYVRALLSGLRDASSEKSFVWRSVLDLAEWVISQPRTEPESERTAIEQGDEPGWSWSRRAVAALVESGLGQGPAEIPFLLRSEVWRVLEPLTRDPDPTPEYEAQYSGSNMDPVTLAINSTRGIAMQGTMKYAGWVRRHVGLDAHARGFDEIPEVRDVLDEHLDPTRDPSLAVRSVYGQWLPWLIGWDRSWAVSRLPRILPRSEELVEFRDVTWDTFVIMAPAYNESFEVLRKEYEVSVD